MDINNYDDWDYVEQEYHEQSYSEEELTEIRNKKRFSVGDIVYVTDKHKNFWLAIGHENDGCGPFKVLSVEEVQKIGPVGHTQLLTIKLKGRKNIPELSLVSGYFFS